MHRDHDLLAIGGKLNQFAEIALGFAEVLDHVVSTHLTECWRHLEYLISIVESQTDNGNYRQFNLQSHWHTIDYEGTVPWTPYDVDETLAYLRERGHEAPFDRATADDSQDQLAKGNQRGRK